MTPLSLQGHFEIGRWFSAGHSCEDFSDEWKRYSSGYIKCVKPDAIRNVDGMIVYR